MKPIIPISIILLCLSWLPLAQAQEQAEPKAYDVVVAGGGASGVAAAIQSARLGCSTLLLSEYDWIGGMLTSAGVSAVDGNYRLQAGLFGEFRKALVEHYGSDEALNTGWVSRTLFEPSVGNRILHEMVAAEPNLTLKHNAEVVAAKPQKTGGYRLLVQVNGKKWHVDARCLIDATELGDVAAMLGVPYDLGMEARSDTGEDIAPPQANNIIQDLTYTAILKEYDHPIEMTEPKGYDPKEFACSCDNPNCKSPKEPHRKLWSPEEMLNYGKLPNGKYMLNWPIEGNDYYANVVEATPAVRQRAYTLAKERTLRMLYFIHHELGFDHIGLADDEYTQTPDRLPYMPYHRESRRIRGAVRFDLNHLEHPYDQEKPLYRTCIAVGDYPVDHHHAAYDGQEALPDLHFHPIPSYGIPMGVVVPPTHPCLLVAEKSVSVSNVVNGTTRLQPVVMQLGQAAGALAALSVRDKKLPTEVSVRKVQSVILDAGGYLLPYLDLPKESPRFRAMQKIGATGILRGEGRNVNWSNETWLRVDDPLLYGEVFELDTYYPEHAEYIRAWQSDPTKKVTTHAALALLSRISGTPIGDRLPDKALRDNPDQPISRGVFAYLLDQILDPFSKEVRIDGTLIK